MKKFFIKRILKTIAVSVLSLLIFTQTAGCGRILEILSEPANTEQFYNKVCQAQELIDILGNDIYNNWHDAVYEDKFDDDINKAISAAQEANTENIEAIFILDQEITALYKTVKDGSNSHLVKEVMEAYTDYFEFVVNVSGSFNSYSESFEILKKELSGKLRELYYEL